MRQRSVDGNAASRAYHHASQVTLIILIDSDCRAAHCALMIIRTGVQYGGYDLAQAGRGSTLIIIIRTERPFGLRGTPLPAKHSANRWWK